MCNSASNVVDIIHGSNISLYFNVICKLYPHTEETSQNKINNIEIETTWQFFNMLRLKRITIGM